MQAIRREHAAAALLAHQREDVDVRAAGALVLLARDLVEALDLVRYQDRIPERRAGGGLRPVRLRQREARRARRVFGDARMDQPQLCAIYLLRRAGDDVVRADK